MSIGKVGICLQLRRPLCSSNNEAVLTPLIDSMLESKNLDDSCKPSIAEPINDLACCLLPVKKNALALEHPLPW